MKKQRVLLVLISLCFSISTLSAINVKIEKNGWVIEYNETSKTFKYTYNENQIFSEAYPVAKYNIGDNEEVEISSSSFSKVSIKEQAVGDNFGTGIQYSITFEEPSSEVKMEQDFFFYDEKPYFLTTLHLSGSSVLKSNYLAPITQMTSAPMLPRSSDNRMLFVPWDNDGFIRYETNTLNTTKVSNEVTAVYNGGTRNGIVIGSVEHDTWKSAVRIKASGNELIEEFSCYSGESSNITRDKLPHGKVVGDTVSSAKMFVGFFDDWREGMDTYGKANALVAPARRTWKKGTPIGWNSWGVIAEKISFDSANDVSLFFKDEMFDKGFHNEQENVIIDLDSFWDNFSIYRIKDFAKKVKERGQTPGIYWCPFSYWGWDLNSQVEGSSGYKYSDCVIRINGEPHKQGGYCLDPTHPAVKERIRYQFNRFKEWGYEYAKLDFVTDGAIQGDSYYNKDVTTAIQAYNEGFEVVLDAVGEDFFLALSIAPVFPYQYGNSRRISCDAWGGIGNTQYVMNCLSFGWWTDQLYQFNDPDHIVLRGDGGSESEGENRARITSGAITGMLLLGDNYSDRIDRGNPTVSKERSLKYATNPEILKVARLGKSFRPVYGHKASWSNGLAENIFMLDTEEYFYVACINYHASTVALSGTLSFEDLGLDKDSVESITELWAGDDVKIRDTGFIYAVPASDAKVYELKKKKTGQGIISENGVNNSLDITVSSGILDIKSENLINKVEVYNLQGQKIAQSGTDLSKEIQINVQEIEKNIIIVKCYFESEGVAVRKIFVK